MTTILVLTGGSDSDAPVFETALAAAQPLAAHLQFVHIRIGSGQAAIYSPHVEFARGPALVDALARLESDADRRSAAFGDHVRALYALRHCSAGWAGERADGERCDGQHAGGS